MPSSRKLHLARSVLSKRKTGLRMWMADWKREGEIELASPGLCTLFTHKIIKYCLWALESSSHTTNLYESTLIDLRIRGKEKKGSLEVWYRNSPKTELLTEGMMQITENWYSGDHRIWGRRYETSQRIFRGPGSSHLEVVMWCSPCTLNWSGHSGSYRWATKIWCPDY